MAAWAVNNCLGRIAFLLCLFLSGVNHNTRQTASIIRFFINSAKSRENQSERIRRHDCISNARNKDSIAINGVIVCRKTKSVQTQILSGSLPGHLAGNKNDILGWFHLLYIRASGQLPVRSMYFISRAAAIVMHISVCNISIHCLNISDGLCGQWFAYNAGCSLFVVVAPMLATDIVLTEVNSIS